MPTREIGHLIKPVVVLDAAVYTTTQTTVGLDSQGFESVTYLVKIGLWTSGVFTYALMESNALGGPYTVVAPSDQHNNPSNSQVTSTANDEIVLVLDYLGAKRYTQLVATASGTSSSVLFGVIGMLGHPRDSILFV